MAATALCAFSASQLQASSGPSPCIPGTQCRPQHSPQVQAPSSLCPATPRCSTCPRRAVSHRESNERTPRRRSTSPAFLHPPLPPQNSISSRPRAGFSDVFPVSEGDESGMELLSPPSAPSSSGMSGMDVPQAPEEVKLLMCIQSPHSPVTVLEFPDNPEVFGQGLAGSRILKLDSSNNIHSMWHPTSVWTDSYWDDLAAVACFAPRGGSVGILGLGSGTVSRAILSARPDIHVEGWEIDTAVIEVSREFLGLAEQETPTPEGGRVTVHEADAFEAESSSEEGFSCLIVDLFLKGELLPKLTQLDTWREFKRRMMPGGRLVVNCGGPTMEPSMSVIDTPWQATVAAMKALLQAFPGCCYYKCSDEKAADANFLVMAGGPLALGSGAVYLPKEAAMRCQGWKRLSADSQCLQR